MNYRTNFSRRAAASVGAVLIMAAAGLAAGVAHAAPPAPAAPAAGVIRTPSAYGFDETVARVKADIAAKGIRFFTEIDQGALAAEAGVPVAPSKLLIFGNPPLGLQFLASNPYAGLDWPVRILVTQDAGGRVFVAYTDFAYMADRYQIRDRDAAFAMAAQVAASIASSAAR